MILYKYRSLANFEHVLDIILSQRLHCSPYLELNDPFEGLFVTTRNIGGADFKVNEAKNLFEGTIDKVKICSLSSDLNDVRLWSYYADGHKGIVFEIDFSGLEKRNGSKVIQQVTYSEKLPSSGWWDWSIMLGAKPSVYEVLSCKTKHWEFESEYRIINESERLEEDKYYDIKNRIKAIYLGTRTSDKHRELLKNIVQGKIPIWTTKVNSEKIIVEPDKLIEG